MKLLVKILLLVSVGLNVFFIWATIRIRNNKIQSEQMFGGDINKTTWSKGLASFMTKVKEKDKPFADKKYYYINIWNTWCTPCVKEMPWLDSLAGTLNKDVGYIFVSDINDEVAISYIKRQNYHLKNFIFLNDMNDFVSSICNEVGTKNKVYPMVLILDQKGKIYHYSTGAYSNSKEAREFVSIIHKLP